MSGSGKQVRVRGQHEAGQGYYGDGVAREGHSEETLLVGGDLEEAAGNESCLFAGKGQAEVGGKGQVPEAQRLACVRTAKGTVAGAERVTGKIGSEKRCCREKEQIMLPPAGLRPSVSARGRVLNRRGAGPDLRFTGKKVAQMGVTVASMSHARAGEELGTESPRRCADRRWPSSPVSRELSPGPQEHPALHSRMAATHHVWLLSNCHGLVGVVLCGAVSVKGTTKF